MGRMPYRGAGGGSSSSSSQRTPIEAPDSLHSTAYAKILDLVSEGEIVGLSDAEKPLTCVFLNETPVANADGTLNFTNVFVDSRVGTQTQDIIKGFDSVEAETGVNVELTYATPWVQTLANTDIDAVNVRLSVPVLSQTSKTTGDTTGYKVSYSIQLNTDGGGFVSVLDASFDGKASNKYERGHRIDLPTAVTGWEIKVVRTTANDDSSYVNDDTFVEAYVEIVDGKYRMPMSAVIAVTVDSRNFTSIPSRAYKLKGRIIQVPSNYDAETGTYDGVWDGTFQPAYSSNPAWAFYDMVTNNIYGLGHLVSPAMIDKWYLYNIAQYCDELVDDGFGGQERRFECHLYLQTRGDAVSVLQNMATVFRGVMYASEGTIAAVADMPADPVYTYNLTNVAKGTRFKYSGSRRRLRHTVALVSWNDMSDFCRAKVEYVEDEDGINRYGVQPTEVIAIGCRSRGQAKRMGRHIIATERYETDGVTFTVGLDGTVVPPGKIVLIADPLRAGRRTGGRVRSATINSITVDKLPIVVAGNSVSVVLPDMTLQKRTVLSVAGDTITMTANFSAVPVAHAVWIVESEELAGQTFRIISVKENSTGIGYDMEGLQHVPGKFALIEQGIKIDEPPISVNSLIGPPVEVVLSDFERVVSNLPVLVLGVDWDAVPGATGYEVSLQRNNGNWTPPVRVTTNRYELEGAVPGVYIGRVSAINSQGYTSAATKSVETTIETANFTIVVDVESVGGVLTLDCSRAEQWRLFLVENITEVVFLNTSVETTLIIEINQTGNYTIAWPANIVPVSGVPYVVTIGGTELNPKIDTVGLHTDNRGVSWALRVDQEDVPASGGTGGAMTISVTPNPAYGYAAANPSVAVDITVTGGTLPLTYAWARAAGGTGDWAGSSGNTGGGNFSISDPTAEDPTFSRTGSTDGYVVQNWRLQVTDSATPPLTAQTIFEIGLEDDGVIGGGGGWRCAWSQALLPDGRRCKDVRVGSHIMGVDPITMERKPLLVTYSRTAMADCVLLRFADGTELTCSTTAPMPTPDGLVHAPEMLGKMSITGSREGLGWSECVAVLRLGLMEVQHISCQDGCFLVGNIAGKWAAHHNMKWIPELDDVGRVPTEDPL